MSLNFIRKIDEHLGPPICRLLLVIRRLVRRRRSPVHPEAGGDATAVENILVIKYFGAGSILMVSPAITRMKERHPTARVTILTLGSNREICEMLPSFDAVLCLRIDGLRSFLASYLGVLQAIRRLHPDMVVDLEFFTNFSALTTLLVSIFKDVRRVVGFHAPAKWRNRVYDDTVSFDHSRHISKAFLKVVNALYADAAGEVLSFAKERDALLEHMDSSPCERLLRMRGRSGGAQRWICVNINAGPLSLHRRWPVEHFEQLVKDLLQVPDISVCLIGSAEDVPYVGAFCRRLGPSPRIVDIAGQTSTAQLIGVLSRCEVFVTNDSGPLHLAHVLGVPTVSFFGPETPYLYGPLGTSHHVFYEDRFCSPCLNIYNSKLSQCRENLCLRSITPERVARVLMDKYLAPETGGRSARG